MGAGLRTLLVFTLFFQGIALPASGCESFRQLREHPRFFTARPMAPGEPRPVSTSGKTLETDMKERVFPFFNSGTAGTFNGKAGVPIAYRYWEVPNAKGTVVLLHGASESMSVYMEMIFNLAEQGYNVYAMDHRGHGHSGRMAKDPGMLYIDRFENYVDDVDTYVNQVVKKNGHDKVSIIGSSMGGQIAMQYALKRPNNVERLVLSTPMLGIKFPYGLPDRGAQAIATVMKVFGGGATYVPGEHGPVDEGYETRPPGRQRTSWQWRLQQEKPDLLVDGASAQWVAEATRATYQSWGHLEKLKMPVLLVQAERDQRIQNSAIDRAAVRMGDAQVNTYPQATHGILRSEDGTRDLVMRDMFRFLGGSSGAPGSGTTGDAP